MESPSVCSSRFGEEHFGAADFGDKRLTRRLIDVSDQMARHPGGSLPDKIPDPAGLKGLYRLMGNKKVTHDGVLRPHYERTFQRMRDTKGVVLLVQDGTELDYSSKKSLCGLGQIGKGSRRGYICQNTLAVIPQTREVLGLARQILHRRDDVPENETRQQKRTRESRESRLWKRSSQAIHNGLGEPLPGQLWVEVCDRGADLFEYLDSMHQREKQYLVRSKSNRVMTVQIEGNTRKSKVHDFARSLAEMGRREVDVPATAHQPARTAQMAVSWAEIQIQPPRKPRGEHRDKPLTVWVIRTWEIDPPAGVEPLEWILLTSVEVSDFEEAYERIDWYADRWIIEEYHKALKTGCGIEEPQFTTEEALQPTIAVLSVVSQLLLTLRDESRRADAKVRRATDVIPVELVMILSGWRFKAPRSDLTVHEFYYALARLGGHQNRKHDHPPGWIVLWRGWTKLQAMLEGAHAIGAMKCG